MFDTNVEVHWPEVEEEKSTVLKSLVAVPGHKFANRCDFSKQQIAYISGEDKCNKSRPNFHIDPTGYSHRKDVRYANHIGSLDHTSPAEFVKQRWQDIYDASTAALTAIDPATGPEEPDWFTKLWPYFKSAVKNVAMKYQLNMRLQLGSGMSDIKDDHTINTLPSLFSRLQQQRDDFNNGTDALKLLDTTRRSLVKVWVAKFTAMAEAHRYEFENPTFTKKQARAYVRQAANLCRKHGMQVSCKVWMHPETLSSMYPLRVANWTPVATVKVKPKSWDWTDKGKEVTRVDYEMYMTRNGHPEHSEMVAQSLGDIIDRMHNRGDYNLTMAESQKLENVYDYSV